MVQCFTVVENAGYVGERDVRTGFSTARGARLWIKRNYAADEVDDLHVAVACDRPDGRTYDY